MSKQNEIALLKLVSLPNSGKIEYVKGTGSDNAHIEDIVHLQKDVCIPMNVRGCCLPFNVSDVRILMIEISENTFLALMPKTI